MRLDVKIQGARELDRAFRALPENVGRRVWLPALRKGANLIKRDAQRRAPIEVDAPYRRTPGTLRRAIRVRAFRAGTTPRGEVHMAVFVTKGRKQKHDAFYAHFVEFGTSRSRAQPFLKPAFDTNASRAIAAIEAALRPRFERVVALERAKQERAALKAAGGADAGR